mmetsp:Transcript_3892/g.5730  ORF Transcript_3892/g.5730 Transcript_3892/m.5730 type:complete len:100 (+) Transcript_3892:778-1077(+)
MFFILLYSIFVVFSSNKSFNIKNCVFWVSSKLILCSVSDQTFCFCECDIRRCDPVSKFVCDNFYSTTLENSNTRISCSKIDTNNGTHVFFFSCHKGQTT